MVQKYIKLSGEQNKEPYFCSFFNNAVTLCI